MATTDIAIRETGAELAERDVVDGWIKVASDVIKVANLIADTDFVPAEYRDSPPAVAAAMLTGRELGIGPMMSLRHVQIVKGVPTLSAEYKRARVLAAGHEFDVLEISITRCRVSGRRKGSHKPPLVITFTIEDAQRAGLIKDKGAWKTRPRRMLFARAGSELCDFLFADVTNGLATTELVAEGVEGDEFAGYDEAPAQAAPAPAAEPKPAQRTARRRQAATAKPDPTPPQQASPSSTSAAADLPPLPGEEEEEEPPAADLAIDTDAPDDTDYDTPATVTKPQLTKIAVVFGKLGFTNDEREQRLAAASKIINRKISTGNDLSFNEAKVLIDTLERCEGSRERLIALLAEGEVPDGGA